MLVDIQASGISNGLNCPGLVIEASITRVLTICGIGPSAGPGWGKTDFPGAASIPEGRARDRRIATGKSRRHIHIRDRVRVTLGTGEGEFYYSPLLNRVVWKSGALLASACLFGSLTPQQLLLERSDVLPSLPQRRQTANNDHAEKQ
jgi:hypothetical protein